MRKLLVILALTGAIATLPGVAVAGDSAQKATDKPTYSSPQRDQCEAELAKDVRWQAELRDRLRPDIHQEDANLMLTNKRHVVMAYAALWILAVVFLVLLFLRQQRLAAAMARLSRDLDKAAAQ